MGRRRRGRRRAEFISELRRLVRKLLEVAVRRLREDQGGRFRPARLGRLVRLGREQFVDVDVDALDVIAERRQAGGGGPDRSADPRHAAGVA